MLHWLLVVQGEEPIPYTACEYSVSRSWGVLHNCALTPAVTVAAAAALAFSLCGWMCGWVVPATSDCVDTP